MSLNSSIQTTPSSAAVIYCLKDQHGEVYPLLSVTRYVDAYFMLQDVRAALREGRDTGLLMPPPWGAQLELICPLSPAAQAAHNCRQEKRDTMNADLLWQSLQAEFEEMFPRRQEQRPTLAERAACRLSAWLGREDVTLLVIAVVCWEVFGRRLLP